MKIYIDPFRNVKELKEKLSDIRFVLDIIKDKLEATSVDEKIHLINYKKILS